MMLNKVCERLFYGLAVLFWSSVPAAIIMVMVSSVMYSSVLMDEGRWVFSLTLLGSMLIVMLACICWMMRGRTANGNDHGSKQVCEPKQTH